MEKIGFIGLGRMGRPMAGNMQRKGFSLMVYDIAEAPVQELVGLGAVAADSIAQLAAACGTVITVLPSHAEVEEVVLGAGGILASAAAGTLVMDMSTVDPASTDRLAAALADTGMRFVDAPIGRLASHADRGECLFMVGADADDFAQVRPMLEAMGTDIHHCGPPGSGIRTKLVNNYLAITSCQMNAEALALAQRFGLALEKTLEVIHGTTATNGQLKINYATKVLTGDTEPGFHDLAVFRAWAEETLGDWDKTRYRPSYYLSPEEDRVRDEKLKVMAIESHNAGSAELATLQTEVAQLRYALSGTTLRSRLSLVRTHSRMIPRSGMPPGKPNPLG